MKDCNGVATPYSTRSPYVDSAAYILFVKNDGTVYQYETLTTSRGVLIELSI